MFNDLTEKKYSEALLYFFINKTAYSGMIQYNSKGEFNVPYGRYANLNTCLN
jgi:DNA adenine methylase